MRINANFEFVSKEQFEKDFNDSLNIDVNNIYESLKKPRRATLSSAGYDFYSPIDFSLFPGDTIKIPTGIRCMMPSDYVLMIYPRSGLGFKYRLQLNNTVGVIDSDYYNALNEGHIMIKITNDSNEGKVLNIKQGEGIAQGIFQQYAITIDDEVEDVRIGGFGSTTSKN